MKSIIPLLAGSLLLCFAWTGCAKKVDAIDDYGVTVTLKNSGAKYVTGDLTIKPKDSLFFDFTITSSKGDMAVIEIQKNAAKIDTFQVSGTDKRTFSGFKKYQADSIAGNFSYRIVAKDKNGVFLGDGKKVVNVFIQPDFNFFSSRLLYVPDSIAKTNKCYYATTTGYTYSYNDGPTHSEVIDFGFFYDTTTTKDASKNPAPKFTFYALSASAFAPYDLTAWTKNATTFRTPGVTFASLTSAGAIRSAWNTGKDPAGPTATPTGPAASPYRYRTSDRTSLPSNLTGGMIMFKTAAGKYGAISVNFLVDSMGRKDSYINLDVKVER